MAAMHRPVRAFRSAFASAWLGACLGLVQAVAVLGGCGDDDYPYSSGCRFDPDLCAGGPGAECRADVDCEVGYECCTERSNCGGGMCTLSCRVDLDCPPDMACQHDKCFFLCRSDLDCAVGQSCEHDHTVCEWP